jgi:nucleoside-diphosphate-sugar epimerase
MQNKHDPMKRNMTTLVVGASGATGKLLVEQLLASGQRVKIIVRLTSIVPNKWNENQQVTIIKGNLSEMTVGELAGIVANCESVASCLGHNLTWSGIYGKPRKLVTNAVKLLCEAIISNSFQRPVKFVLMNTDGNRNRDLNEPISFLQKIVIGLLRLLLPPHPDNEKAADYLRVVIGQDNSNIEWAAVRPSNLINDENVTEYSIHKSPTRSALFNPGKTSRVNVGHFMSRLIQDDSLWNTWKGQMPVIYNNPGDTK